MKRFLLAPAATTDLDDIIAYIQSLPARPGLRLGRAIQQALSNLAEHPDQGHVQERYTALANQEIRRFVSGDYVFYYASQSIPIVFTAILHGARDTETIMRQRLS